MSTRVVLSSGGQEGDVGSSTITCSWKVVPSSPPGSLISLSLSFRDICSKLAVSTIMRSSGPPYIDIFPFFCTIYLKSALLNSVFGPAKFWALSLRQWYINTMRSETIVLILLFISVQLTQGLNWYVNGTYEGQIQNGTLERPCKSISKCVHDFATNGDTIYILPGIYNGTDNTGICSAFVTRRRNCTASRLTLTGLHHNADEVIWSFTKSSPINVRALVGDDNRFIRLANMTIRDFTVVSNVTVTSVASTRVEGGL